jgi:hypothetical protein
MKPGIYKAQVIGAGMTTDSKGLPRPFMKLKTAEGDITWYGSLSSDKAQEIAVKAVTEAGFHGKDWDDLAQGVSFFNEADFTVTVVEDEYQGKKSIRARWINSAKDIKSMSPLEVKSKVSSAGLFAKFKKPSTASDDLGI